MNYDIEIHIEELRAELADCIDPRERKIIAAELAEARAVKAATHEDAYIERMIGLGEIQIPF